MEISEIMCHLEVFDGTLPREALEAAIERKEEITPLLLHTLNNVIQNPENFAKHGNYILHAHAIYLLAQFREKRAYPLIHKFFAIPHPTIELLIGESHIEQAGRILASVSNGDLSLIKELIENPDVYEYVRGSSLDALIVLMANGELSRELVVEYFSELFDCKLERKEAFIWNGLIAICLDLKLVELHSRIKTSFSNKFVIVENLTLDEVNQVFEKYRDEPTIISKDDFPNTYINSAIEELEYVKNVLEDKGVSYQEPFRTESKIGRNQPCPCGSGKKYKKCCG